MLRRLMPRAAVFSSLVCLGLAGLPGQPALSGTPEARCLPAEIAGGRVASLREGGSLVLEDGREIRLIGLDMPLRMTGATAGIAQDAWAELTGALSGQQIALRTDRPQPDRHGRIPALVFIAGSDIPVQYALLQRGYARVWGAVDDQSCRVAMLQHEAQARERRVGLWADPGYGLRDAADLAALLSFPGRMAVVEGRVVSVRRTGGFTYVNFGRRWSQSLTATIRRQNERALATAGLEPKALEGRMVRVRGFVERRNGPVIEVMRGDQIEIVERK